MKKPLVVCVGNRLVGDDAAGPHVFDALTQTNLSDLATLCLLETRGIGLLDELQGQDLLIVVDAVQLGAVPGTLHILRGDALREVGRMPVTSHDIALNEALSVCALLYPERMPGAVLFIGIEGANFNILGASLSREVRAAIPRVVEEIRAACRRA